MSPRWVFLGALAMTCVAAQTCDASAFPVSLVDLQCFGLTPYAMATNEAECLQRCCDLRSTTCSVWQYCPLVRARPQARRGRAARREARVRRAECTAV